MGLHMPLWGIATVFWQAFLGPFVGAAEPLSLPLPQEIDYAMYIRGQLLANSVSFDPTLPPPRVAAEQTGNALEAFIVNYEPCVVAGDVAAYRLIVRNVSQSPLSGVTAHFRYPASVLTFKEGQGTPAGSVTLQNPGDLTWNIGSVLPGHANWREANITFVVAAPAGGLSTSLTVTGGDAITITGHTVPATCPKATIEPGTPLPSKQPVIVCDPGETDCTASLPTLGKLFNAVIQEPARRPIVCSPNDPDGCTPNRPQLGARFAEAVASLLPGECSVLEDAILAEPDFHDGLNRRANVAALFMRPLYDSGQDFSRLILENELLGIEHTLHTQMTLRAIHTRHWHARVNPLDQVLRGGITTDDIRGRITSWHLDWLAETRAAQSEIYQRYQALQETRKNKFKVVAEAAVTNAKSSIERACGSAQLPEEDGGLGPLLFVGPSSVQAVYQTQLDDRLAAFETTQALFVDPNNTLFPEDSRAITWQTQLRAALTAFDAGERGPLEKFIADIPLKDESGFATAWQFTYERHAVADRAGDNDIRLENWEVALDAPKTVAGACARDTTLAARVEVSWCESGIYPDAYILAEARTNPPTRVVTPPIILDEYNGTRAEDAQIDVQRTVGVSCRGLPGDPFWAPDCSCNCNQLVVGKRDGNILFCQAGQAVVAPPVAPAPAPPTSDICAPLVCPSGRQYPTCNQNGTPISYFINPCRTDSAPPAVLPGTQSLIAPPTSACAPLVCANGASFPTCTESGAPISYLINPCRTLLPTPDPESSPPSIPSGVQPIIRDDIYSIATAPRTQDECLQEKNVRTLPETDDHFMVDYQPPQ